MKKTAVIMVAVTALLCLFLAGCGGRDKGKITTTTHTTTRPANTTHTTMPSTAPHTGNEVTNSTNRAGEAVSDVVGGAEEVLTDAGRAVERGAEDIFRR